METIEEQPKKEYVLKPVADKNRIQVMDLLRGFALIGIIFMNIEWFNRPVSDLLSFDFSQTGGDWAASWLVKVFIEGKFYKLFSIIFGMGFAVMLLNAQQAGRPFGAWFTRRMLALFVFGMLHMVFLWGGDILHDYAVAGLYLLGFVALLNTKRLAKYNHPRTFVKVGFTLVLLPLVISLVAAIVYGSIRSSEEVTTKWQQRAEVVETSDRLLAEFKASQAFLDISYKDETPELVNNEAVLEETVEQESVQSKAELNGEVTDDTEEELSPEEVIALQVEERFEYKKNHAIEIEKESQVFKEASFWETTQYRYQSTLDSLANTFGMAFFICLPLFMMGYWLVASERLTKPEEHTGFFNVLCWGGLGLGIILNVSSVLIMLHPAAQEVDDIQMVTINLFFYSEYVLCFGYIGLFVKLVKKAWFIKSFSWLSLLGKMALTNYISHSIILTSIFYGYAGGMFGEIGRVEQIGIAVLILFVQVLLCKVWLTYFRFGPLEWLWRSITYLKLQPLMVSK
ncbi:DUF418 domain-containing protein [Thalassotalea piscium]